jgi:hypothetical protein
VDSARDKYHQLHKELSFAFLWQSMHHGKMPIKVLYNNNQYQQHCVKTNTQNCEKFCTTGSLVDTRKYKNIMSELKQNWPILVLEQKQAIQNLCVGTMFRVGCQNPQL